MCLIYFLVMLEGAINCIQSRLYCGNILNLLVHVFIVYVIVFEIPLHAV